jgi:hypothetical protein
MKQKQQQAQAAVLPAPATGGASPPRLLDDYLTREQLAAELDKCIRTLDRWHAMRIGPPRVTIGRVPLYTRESVAAWIQKQEHDPAAAGAGRRRRA